jgi:hypothetical protein
VFDRSLDEQVMLVEVDRRRFARGADGHDRVGSLLDMPVDEFAKRIQVETAVIVHRRDDRDHAAGELCHLRISWFPHAMSGAQRLTVDSTA